ncbi:MAG: sugar phosphate isomerase/epimerase [Candidatus Rokuibacteriota bacterium]|nr:MAG: sugar phosphate isomerase/epimerase [Candidatus Rokubacteria bacterium]
MTLRERIGVDLGGRRRLEDGLAWAAANGVHYVDMCLEGAPDHPNPNAPATWTAAREAALRATCERHRIHLGLHSASAVNVAETSLLADAAEQYLETYIDLGGRLGAEWIVVHGGYHFTGDYAARRAAGIERLQRAAALAERAGARLLLENLNREPEHAEIRYLAHNLEECREYFGRIQSPSLGWAFTVNHAHLVPEGIDGFLDAMDLGRCGEVRVADSHGHRAILPTTASRRATGARCPRRPSEGCACSRARRCARGATRASTSPARATATSAWAWR